MPDLLRIFVSSPSDVKREREVAAQTVERLARDYARFYTIDLHLWENEPLNAARHFQDDIEPPSTFDIVILILHSRIGTPLPERTKKREYRGIDGRAPVTGTEWEYEDALRATRATGVPDLLVYRSREAVPVDSWDAKQRQQQLDQLTALDQFWARHFANKGLFLGAYTEFKSLEIFASTLESHLRRLIENRIEAARSSPTPLLWTESPFRGLESYEFEHAPIFFGQDDACGRAMLQLTSGAAAGPAFLLLLGASGSGKSSLAKAGLAPRLFVPRRVPGAAFLRRVTFRPADSGEGEDIFKALAQRLVATPSHNEGLPELVGPGRTIDDLARLLRGGDPAYAFSMALDQVAATERAAGKLLEFESGRLLLVIDQLEELYANDRFTPADRVGFVDLLAALAGSGLVWVIGAMRKDFWHRADETPVLVRLAEGAGRLELLPPSPAQISQMIRMPAEAAGVSFEPGDGASSPVARRSGIALNEVIAEALFHQPGSLPLLSYLLSQLYQADVLEAGGHMLTFATYDRLGGLDGAIATKAEEILAGLPEADRAALGPVLFALIQIGSGDGDVQRALARRVRLSSFPEGTAQRRLVDAFLDPAARLLVSDVDTGGQPTVRVAHEALLTRWSLAREFFENNAELLKIRQRVEERLARGASAGPKGALPPAARGPGGLWRAFMAGMARTPGLLVDLDLQEAERLLRERGVELEPETRAYVERSGAEDRRFKSRAQRLAISIAAVMSVLAVASAGLGELATLKWRQAQLSQSRFLAATAEDRVREADFTAALSTVLEGVPRPGAGRPLEPEAVGDLKQIIVADPELGVLAGHQDIVKAASFSPDGRRVATASYDGTARVWDSETGVEVARFAPGSKLMSAAFSADGARLLTAGDDGALRIWSIASGRQLWQARSSAPLRWAAFSPVDPDVVASAGADGAAMIWSVRTSAGRLLAKPASAPMECIRFSRDGTRLAAASDDGEVRILDAQTGAVRQELKGSGPMLSAAFSPDGTLVVAASRDHTARIWTLSDPANPAVLTGHTDDVTSAAFSPDQKRVITSSMDWTVRVWDVATAREVTRLRGHRSTVQSAAFSPDGTRIVSAGSDGTARIWNAPAGRQARLFGGHDQAVNSVQVSADGQRLATASSDGKARVFPIAGGAPTVFDDKSGKGLNSAEMSRDLAYLATASDGGRVRIWRLGSPDQPPQVLGGGGIGHTDMVETATFSPDQRQLLSASRDRTALVWDLSTGAVKKIIAGHGGPLASAYYSRDGQRIVTASLDNTSRIWSSATGTSLAVLRGHAERVFDAVFSPDGKRIVTASVDQTARVWDAETAAPLFPLLGHTAIVEAAAYSADGRRIATASDDKTIRIWDAANGQPLAILQGHTDAVRAVAFSPKGDFIVSGSSDRTARVWDIRTPAPGNETLLDVGRIPVSDVLAWSDAAQFEQMSGDARTQLGLKRLSSRLSFPKDPTACDETAADPSDPARRAAGVALSRLKEPSAALSAIRACAPAGGDSARTAYQRGRALAAAGRFGEARTAFERALAQGYAAAGEGLGRLLSDPATGQLDIDRGLRELGGAADHGVAVAAYDLGALYEHGVRTADGRQVLAPDPARSASWLDRAVKAGEPGAIAHAAGRDERAALDAVKPGDRTAILLKAFQGYALAARRAQREGWPDETWRDWRYRRASLARVLARKGDMSALADAYRDVVARSPN